jgi:hypothetical protein
MASAFYDRVVKEMSGFLGEKADGVLSRQMKHCSKTADSFEKADLITIMSKLVQASTLYMADESKGPMLAGKLERLSQ